MPTIFQECYIIVKSNPLFSLARTDEQAFRLLLFRYLMGGHIVLGLSLVFLALGSSNVAAHYDFWGGGLCLSGVIALVLYRYGKQPIAKLVLLGLDFAFITLAVVMGRGGQNLVFLNYIGLALIVGVLYGGMANFALALVSVSLGLGFLFAGTQILSVEYTHLLLWLSYLFILPLVILSQNLLTCGLRINVKKTNVDLQQRKQTENYFQQLLDAAPNVLIVVNEQGLIELCNHSTERLFGYLAAELIGQPIELLVPLDLKTQDLQHKIENRGYQPSRRIRVEKTLPGANPRGETMFLEVWLEPLETAEKGKILISVLDVTEREKAEETRQILLEISQNAVAAGTPTEILTKTMNILRKSLGFDYIGLRLVQHPTGGLYYVSSTGTHEMYDLVANWVIEQDQGIAGTVAHTGIPECVNNAHLDPRTIYPPGVQITHEHAICLPLIAENQVFGVLFIARYLEPPFTPEEFELAKMYLSHVTLAIYNTHLREIDQKRLQELEKLYQKIQGQKEQLEARVEARTAELHKEILERKQVEENLLHRNESLTTLHKISLDLFNRRGVDQVLKMISAKATELLQAPAGYLAVIENDYLVDWATIPENLPYNKVTRKIADSAFYLRATIEQKQPIQVDDYSSQPGLRPQIAALGLRASLLAPILGGQKVLGLLGVFHTVEGKTFDHEDLQTLELFAQLAALALDNAHLYTQEQHEFTERKRTEEKLLQNVEHLSRLQQITLDLLQQRDVDTLQQMLVNQISLFLEVDWAVLTLLEGDLLVDRAALKTSIPYEMVSSRREDDPTSPIWQVIDQGKPFLTDNYTLQNNIRPSTISLGLKAAILLPVFIGNACQGILGTGRIHSETPFDTQEIQFSLLLARIAGIILENAYLHETLRQEAIRDPLTNLFNRRFMEESLTRELQRAARLNHPMAVVMIDIDHFKIFNDTYGHSTGDEVLRRLAEIINENIRLSDIACRYGGEEFVLILPDLSATDAVTRMENLRNSVSHFSMGYNAHSLTISIGIAEFPAHGTGSDILLLRADQALYQAKNTGRNRVVCFS